MKDNGLIAQYKHAIDRFGFLNLGIIAPDKYLWKKVEPLGLCQGEFQGLFYAKECSLKKAEVEVLLSQIYPLFFKNSAIYLPTAKRSGEVSGVISDDVLKEDAVLMYDFIRSNGLPNGYAYGNNLSTEELMYRSYFENEALKDFVLMHILDVGCGNVDRHAKNYGVEWKEVDGKQIITGLRLFDFGNARFYLDDFEPNSILSRGQIFRNGLGGGTEVSRMNLINYFKESELVQEFYTNSEIAEIVGNIDVHEHVCDIRDCLGFQITQKLEDNLSGSLCEMAEQMMK